MSAADDVLPPPVCERGLVENDPSRLSELMHPDLGWTTFRGEVLGRDEYVRGNTDGSLRWVGQTLEEPEASSSVTRRCLSQWWSTPLSAVGNHEPSGFGSPKPGFGLATAGGAFLAMPDRR